MSAYCSESDILGEISEPELVQLTDEQTPRLGDIDPAVLGQVIANASGVIDLYCGNVYDVPFNPVPPAVVSIAVTITCYKLYRRREVPDEKNKFTETYREVTKFLQLVNQRKAFLGQTEDEKHAQVQANVTATPWGYGNIPYSSR